MHHRLPPVACCMHVRTQEVALSTGRGGCQQVRQHYPTTAASTKSGLGIANFLARITVLPFYGLCPQKGSLVAWDLILTRKRTNK